MWEKALVPLKEVLIHSGLKVEDIDAVELIGGATRVPKLQVCSFLNKVEVYQLQLLNTHISCFQIYIYIYVRMK